MNRRARNRLIGVTVLILVVVGAILATTWDKAAYQKSVEQVLGDPKLVGQRVKVEGEVVPGSWTEGQIPLRFDIRSVKKPEAGVIKVSYNGTIPNTFGDGMRVIVTGPLAKGAGIEANDMVVVCPSKYDTKDAMTVQALLSRKQMVGTTVRLAGFVGQSSAEGFTLENDKDGDPKLEVSFKGDVPPKGTEVLLTGSLSSDGVFQATGIKEATSKDAS